MDVVDRGVCRNSRSFVETAGRVRQKSGELPVGRRAKLLVHELIDLGGARVSDLLQCERRGCANGAGKTATRFRDARIRVRHSDVSLAQERCELEHFLFNAVYRHPRLCRVAGVGRQRVRGLFDVLTLNPSRLLVAVPAPGESRCL